MCINPEHLYDGNHSSNAIDREENIRMSGGTHNGPSPKLYLGEIWLLKRLANAGLYYKDICKMFKIKKSLFYQLKSYPDNLL